MKSIGFLLLAQLLFVLHINQLGNSFKTQPSTHPTASVVPGQGDQGILMQGAHSSLKSTEFRHNTASKRSFSFLLRVQMMGWRGAGQLGGCLSWEEEMPARPVGAGTQGQVSVEEQRW